MSESQPQTETGLQAYNEGNDDFLRKIAKMKGVKEEVRASASTDPESLERKRQEIGTLLKFTRENVNDIRRLRQERESIPNDEMGKARRSEIDEEVKGMLTENMMLTSFGTQYALATLIDCCSVRLESDKETDKGKVKTHIRISMADILFAAFEDEEDRVDFLTTEDFEPIGFMLHDIGAGLAKLLKAQGVPDPNIFAGEVVDEQGVPKYVLDRYEWGRKMNVARQIKQRAEEALRNNKGSMTQEEIDKLQSLTLDDFFNMQGGNGAQP